MNIRRFTICPQCLERYESNTLSRCLRDRATLVVTSTPEGKAIVAQRKARGMSGGNMSRSKSRKPLPAALRDFDTATPGRL